jgi:hypothetical protein
MLANALQIAGVMLISIGFGLWIPALGVAVLGVGCVLFGIALERR